MGKQHLDALAIAAGLLESLGFGQCTGDIAGVLMNVARNLPRGSVGAALHFERTDVAIELGGTIAKRIAVVDRAGSVQHLAIWADVDVPILVEREICA